MPETNKVHEEDKDYFYDWEEIPNEDDHHEHSEQVYNPYKHLND